MEKENALHQKKEHCVIMKKNFKFYALLALVAVAVVWFGFGGDTGAALNTTLDILESVDVYAQPILSSDHEATEEAEEALSLEEGGWYYSKEEVALYIHSYGRLPENFVSKQEAEDAGWSGGSVERYIPGAAIGGSRFGNYEGLLPKAKGRTWTECDINTNGKSSRGAERIVFSNDGLIYYTPDHYESFELLYGEP